MGLNVVLKQIKALSDQTRLKIFLLLHSFDEICLCYFSLFFEFSAPTVSRHLAILAEAGLIKSRKKGRWVYFSLNRKNKKLVIWQSFFSESLRIRDFSADLSQMQKILAAGCVGEGCVKNE